MFKLRSLEVFKTQAKKKVRTSIRNAGFIRNKKYEENQKIQWKSKTSFKVTLLKITSKYLKILYEATL